MQGPRGTFSSPQLSPIEALGIHARTDAERDRYAKLFAQVTYDDTQRVLAWSRVPPTGSVSEDTIRPPVLCERLWAFVRRLSPSRWAA